MAGVTIDELSPEQKGELACTYAALILHDDGADITPASMSTLIKAAGCNVEGYWPMIMSKMVNSVGVEALIKLGSGAGGGGGGGGGGAAAGAAAGGAGGGEAKAEEKKVEEEEEEEEMDFDLFGDFLCSFATLPGANKKAAERLRLLAAAASTCGDLGRREKVFSEPFGLRPGALQLVKAMEALNPTPEPTKGLLEGKWRLIFASEDVTRSSPFFWGWRRMLEGIPDPSPLSRALFNTEELSESIFAFTDGIPLKNIGEATQTLYNGQIVNRVAVEIWGLGTTVMTTTCRYMPAEDPSELLLTVETTQAVDNTLPLADQVVFPSETFLGDNARLRARVTYLDEDLRIFRNELDAEGNWLSSEVPAERTGPAFVADRIPI
ncbi:unnamed protein product [Symbiodinium microadriaticum]|nr:unnamed protein product [Symbiodinium microadriaticum]